MIDGRARSDEAWIETSHGYSQAAKKTRQLEIDWISNFNEKHRSLRVVNNLTRKCNETVLNKMVNELSNTFSKEEDMYGIVCKYLNDITKILENGKSNNITIEERYLKEYFIVCRKKPDLGVCINDMYKNMAGSLATQLIIEVKKGIEKFESEKIGQIIVYLRMQLLETQSSMALGLLLNQKYIQFYQMKSNDKKTVFLSKLYEMNDSEWIKLFYYFTFDLSLKKEYLSKYVYPPKYFFDNNMSVSCISGMGASSVVYGINYISNDNNIGKKCGKIMDYNNKVSKNDRNEWDTSLKICSHKDECKMYDLINNELKYKFENELKNVYSDWYCPILDSEIKDLDEPKNKRRRLNKSNEKIHSIILLPVLKRINCKNSIRNFSFKVAIALRNLHLMNLYHGDLYWRNIMKNQNDDIFFIDLQSMEYFDTNNENNNPNSQELCFFNDLLQLCHLIGIEPSNEQKQFWKNKFDNNSWIDIYNDQILPIFQNFVCKFYYLLFCFCHIFLHYHIYLLFCFFYIEK